MTTSKDEAYRERDRLVRFLSCVYPAYLGRHPTTEEWEAAWRWIVYIDSPAGQLSWHIHDTELSMFDHLSIVWDAKWDGHTTEEKYERLEALGDIVMRRLVPKEAL